MGVGASMSGVAATPPPMPGAKVGNGATIAAGKAPAAGGTAGAGAIINGVAAGMPPTPGVKVGTGATMAAGKAPAAGGTAGAAPNIMGVGKKAGTPPTPGAVGTGAAIMGVAATPGAIGVGMIKALPLDDINPNTPIKRKLINKILISLVSITEPPSPLIEQ